MTLMVGDKTVVSMQYTLTDEQGNVLDSSQDSEPLAYLHGAKKYHSRSGKRFDR
jgi:FKBP-type peptidyl-prolyl cis-trans isomerase SlyD